MRGGGGGGVTRVSEQVAELEKRLDSAETVIEAQDAILQEIAGIVGWEGYLSQLPARVRQLADVAAGPKEDAIFACLRRLEERMGKGAGPSVEAVNRALLEGSMMLGQSGVPVAPRHQIVSTGHPVAPSRLPQLATIAEGRIPTDPPPESDEWVPIDPRPALEVGMMVKMRSSGHQTRGRFVARVDEGTASDCWLVDGSWLPSSWLTPVHRAEPTPVEEPEGEWVPVDPRPALEVGMMVRVRRPEDVEEGPSWPVEMNCYHGSVLRLVRPERRWWQVEEDGYVFSPDWLTPVRRAEPTPVVLRPGMRVRVTKPVSGDGWSQNMNIFLEKVIVLHDLNCDRNWMIQGSLYCFRPAWLTPAEEP